MAAGFSIEAVALRVSDVERSADYYARLAGLRPAELGGESAVLVDPASGDSVLELTRSERPGPAPSRAAGLFHTAFLYPGREGLGAAIERIRTGEFRFTGAADHGVSEAVYLDDPDGLGIELYRDRPQAEWPRTAAGAIRMFTEPLDPAPILAERTRGSAEETAGGIRVGHVHLRAGDLESAREFWLGEIGLELMAEMPGALFMAADGYHHHIGANTWQSAGAEPAPASGPGLERIVISGGRAQPRGTFTTPEGVELRLGRGEE